VRIKQRCLTLLEVMIVIMILVTVLGVIGLSVNKALVDQKFRTELSTLVDQLRLAQNLMLILGTDIHVKFKVLPENKGTEYWIETETELPKSISKEILQKHHQLRTIKGLFFVDLVKHSAKKGQLDLLFLSHGNVMSKGMMRLATTDQDHPPPNVLQAYIPLVGYPHPISSYFDLKQAEKEYKGEEDEKIDHALILDTYKHREESRNVSVPLKVHATKPLPDTFK